MKNAILILSLLTGLLAIGCDSNTDRNPVEYDTTAPFPPVGVSALALDRCVQLQWIGNQEDDLAGYNIYISNAYDGHYTRIGSTTDIIYTDRAASNGIRYYYAVTAYDYSGNESELSRDVVYSTPRPEGTNVALADRYVSPNTAGYDFSNYRVVNYDTDQTDVYLEFSSTQHPFFVVWNDSEIQDMGFSKNLDEILTAPTTGWSPTKDAQVILGHTYIVKTFDNHYAKMRVTAVSGNSIVFDWAYQLVTGSPDLIRALRTPGMPRVRYAAKTTVNNGSL
jgi:hypothetical protein